MVTRKQRLLIFILNTKVNLFAVNNGIIGHSDAKLHLFALDAEYGDFNIVTDMQTFSGPPGEDKQGVSWGTWVRKTGEYTPRHVS